MGEPRTSRFLAPDDPIINKPIRTGLASLQAREEMGMTDPPLSATRAEFKELCLRVAALEGRLDALTNRRDL